tara:strand:+ start:10001 stop:10480 length:480 start_codon:yes stop_codon:yes gene_type:complete
MSFKNQSLYDILTSQVAETTADLVEAATHDINLHVAMTQEIRESSVTVQNYKIDIVLKEFAGRKKKFYNIIETSTNEIIHQELALFETAMGIVKKYMTGKPGIKDLENYDTEYNNALYETWAHQTRARQPGAFQDVAVAKASRAKQKLHEAKQKILKRL